MMAKAQRVKRGSSRRVFRWSPWRPFPDPSKGQMLTAPMGPGLYELRNRKMGQLILFGRGENVASRMTSLLPAEAGGQGTRKNESKRRYVARNLKNIEYRTKPCPTRERMIIEERMLKQNAASYRFPT